MNPEQESFHHGVEKCKETISNIVRLREFNTIIILSFKEKYCARFLVILRNDIPGPLGNTTFSVLKEANNS